MFKRIISLALALLLIGAVVIAVGAAGDEPAGAPVVVDVIVGAGTAAADKDVLIFPDSENADERYDTLTLTATPDEGWRFDYWVLYGNYEFEDGTGVNDPVVKLRCYSDISANANFVYAEEPAVIRGDADKNEKVTVMDATCIQRWLAKLIDESKIDLIAADADGNGKVDVLDATRIQRWLAKLCNMDGSPYQPDPQPATQPNQLVIINESGYELPIMN